MRLASLRRSTIEHLRTILSLILWRFSSGGNIWTAPQVCGLLVDLPPEAAPQPLQAVSVCKTLAAASNEAHLPHPAGEHRMSEALAVLRTGGAPQVADLTKWNCRWLKLIRLYIVVQYNTYVVL